MKPTVDINRIAAFASRPLPAHVQPSVDRLVAAFREVQLAQAIEKMVKWAYDEGFKAGQASPKV